MNGNCLFFNSILLILSSWSLIFPDKSANVPCHISHQIDPNGTTELSPVSVSENDAEIGGRKSNNCDEVVGDGDLESKRRCPLLLLMSKVHM